MPEVLATQETTQSGEDKIKTRLRVPALSEFSAKRRAMANARLKGLESPKITGLENLGAGDIPGQVIYSVEITSRR